VINNWQVRICPPQIRCRRTALQARVGGDPEAVWGLIIIASPSVSIGSPDELLQGRYAEAEALLKRAIAVAEKSMGPESKFVVGFLDHMISVLKAQGREQKRAPLKSAP
jgi:hypothetical protein